MSDSTPCTGAALRRLRLAASLSLPQLSRLSGVHRATILRIESHPTTRPSLATVARLLAILRPAR